MCGTVAYRFMLLTANYKTMCFRSFHIVKSNVKSSETNFFLQQVIK